MFEVGSKVIYPGHGVALIKESLDRVVGGEKTTFFKLLFECKNVTILVSKDRLLNIGVREVSDAEEVKVALAELYKAPPEKNIAKDSLPAGWSRRQKDYQNRLASGKLVDVAATFRDLSLVAKRKTLSFGEKSLLQTARDLLVQEILAATSKSEAEVVDQINEPFVAGDEIQQEQA